MPDTAERITDDGETEEVPVSKLSEGDLVLVRPGASVPADGVDQIEDLHVWQVCSQLTVATVRLTNTATTLEEQREIQGRVHDHLTDRGVNHATIELVGCADPDTDPVGTTNHSH
jgi:Co/Zn/Cd efflux system component